MITWSPEWNWQRFQSSHPNHRATGELALHAIYPDAGNPFAHLPLKDDEGLEARIVAEIWLLHSPHANHYVDVTDTFDRKVSAVRAQKSQVGHSERLAESLRSWIEPNTAAADLPPGRLAERPSGAQRVAATRPACRIGNSADYVLLVCVRSASPGRSPRRDRGHSGGGDAQRAAVSWHWRVSSRWASS